MPTANAAKRSEGTDGPSGGPVPSPLADEISRAAAAVVERVLAQLTGRVYSPRIKLLDLRQVCEATTLGKTTVYELIDAGKFPKPLRNVGKNLWRESTLIAWADANDPNLEH